MIYSNSTASRGDRQEETYKKNDTWLSSSRSEMRVLQRRRQPTPTQPAYTYYVYHVGGGRTHLFLALVIWTLTTHLFRDGAPFLLLIETPPTIGRSLRCFQILHSFFLLIYPLPV